MVLHPNDEGSYSIKYVLPALVPELSYQDLEIKEVELGSIFTQMVKGEFHGDIDKTKIDLLAYWKDTLQCE
jgi:hypothetical protein